MAELVMTAAGPNESGGANFRAVLQNRNFLFLWIAQLFSQLAQQIINFALVLQVSDLTDASATAEAAMIPLLVKRDKLIAANSLFNLTLTASQLIGFVFLGPPLVKLLGYRWLYILLFGFYVLCAWLTWKLPDPEKARVEDEDG